MDGWIIAFSLPSHLTASKKVQFNQKFWGQTTSSWGGRYQYRRKGVMEEIPHRRLVRGVFLVKKEDVEQVKRFLEGWGADFHVREVRLEREDVDLMEDR